MVELYQGDVIETLKKTSPMADIVVTSPPYNLGKDYRVSKDNKPYSDYLTWVRDWGRALYAYGTHDESHLFLNMGGSPSQPMVPFDVLRIMLDLGWTLQNEIVWVKSIAIGEDTTGHFKPINSPRFVSQTHEFIWHLTKDTNRPLDRLAIGVPYKDKSNLKRWKGVARDSRCPGNSWFMPYPTSQESRKAKLHPATFPPELPKRCLLLAGCGAGTTVLDPFCGTGTTLVVAQEFGAKAVGIDLCREFLEITANRLQVDPTTTITEVQ